MSIRWRMILSYLLVISLVVLFMGGGFIWFLKYFYMENLKSAMLIQARLVAELVRAEMDGNNYCDGKFAENINQICRRLGDELGIRITVMDFNGEVLGDSEENPADMDNHFNRPEIGAALRNEVGSSLRASSAYGEEMFYIAVPLYPAGTSPGKEYPGVLRLAFPLSGITNVISRLCGIVILAAIIAGIGTVVLGFFFSRKITSSIYQMKLLAKSIASGDFNPLPDDVAVGKDEFVELNRTMRQAGIELKNRMERTVLEKNKLEAVLFSMSAGVILAGKTMEIEMLNPEAEKMLGIKGDEVIGLQLPAVLRFSYFQKQLRKVIAGRAGRSFEMSIFYPQARTLQVSIMPVLGANDGIVSILLLFHDITALKSLEKMRSEFAANVSHELHTPLTAIQGYTETILSCRDMKQEQLVDFLEIIARETQRLSAIVDALLDLSRIEENKGIVKKQLVECKRLIKNVLTDMREAIARKEIKILTDLPDEDIYVQGNPEWLRQALSNIVENAVNYNRQGGEVYIRLFAAGQKMIMEVEDRGLGIPPEDLPRVFERFYRVDKARSKKMGGTGLGLSIVKHVLDAHQASYSMHSDGISGTLFRFSLPLKHVN